MLSLHTTFRPAIAMIELIFALVIMGIVMMSAPMLMSTATSSTYTALQQEGINEAASRVNMIMGYAWDENGANVSYVPPILTTTDGHVALNEVTLPIPTARRVGTPMLSQRTFILSNGANPPPAASPVLGWDPDDAGTEDDIDDFIGNSVLSLIANTAVDYTESATVRIQTAIAYAQDPGNIPLQPNFYSNGNTIVYTPFNAAGAPIGLGVGANRTSNVKTITVTLTSNNPDPSLAKNIILHAFSCNIGGYDLKKRF